MSKKDWQHFGNDTKAGRLLRNIYGRDRRGRNVSYPKFIKKRETAEPTRPFLPSGPLERRAVPPRRTRLLRVPKVGRNLRRDKKDRGNKIDFHRGRRKHRSNIEKDIRAIQNERRRFKPLGATTTVSSEKKKLLQNKFQFGKGKALPKAAMPMSLSPSVPSTSAHSTATATKKDYGSEMFEALVDDINFRRRYLARLEMIGDFSKHSAVQGEIESKIRELEELDMNMSNENELF